MGWIDACKESNCLISPSNQGDHETTVSTEVANQLYSMMKRSGVVKQLLGADKISYSKTTFKTKRDRVRFNSLPQKAKLTCHTEVLCIRHIGSQVWRGEYLPRLNWRDRYNPMQYKYSSITMRSDLPGVGLGCRDAIDPWIMFLIDFSRELYNNSAPTDWPLSSRAVSRAYTLKLDPRQSLFSRLQARIERPHPLSAH